MPVNKMPVYFKIPDYALKCWYRIAVIFNYPGKCRYLPHKKIIVFIVNSIKMQLNLIFQGTNPVKTGLNIPAF